MFGSATLEIAIGLAFVYLLFSLVCTSLTEGIARVLRLRASTLKHAIYNMVVGSIKAVNPSSTKTKQSSGTSKTPQELQKQYVDEGIYQHGLIQSLSKSSRYDDVLPLKWFDKGRPSYIPAHTFALALIDTLITEMRSFELNQEFTQKFTEDLDKNKLSDELKTEFKTHMEELGKDAKVSKDAQYGTWTIDDGTNKYHIKKVDSNLKVCKTAPPSITKELGVMVAALPEVLPLKSVLAVFLEQALTNSQTSNNAQPNTNSHTLQYDPEALQKQIEDWYNDVMERVNGWYTRKTRVIVIILAFLLTVTMNIDTLAIAKALSRDETLRNSLVNAADKFLAANRTLPPVAPAGSTTGNAEVDASRPLTLTLGQLEEDITGLDVPLGWVRMHPPEGFDWFGAPFVTDLITQTAPVTITAEIQAQYKRAQTDRRTLPVNWGKKLPGFLLTIIMLSLGAPFWFDRLQNLMNLRSTGKPPK